MYGLPTVKPKRSPMKRAIAGLTKGKRHIAMPMKNSALFILLFIMYAFLQVRDTIHKLRIAQMYKKRSVRIKLDLINAFYLMKMTIRYTLFSLDKYVL